MSKREAGGVVSLRRAADQKPAALRSPCLRREALGPLEGGVRPDVDALDPGRDVVHEGRLAECGHEFGIRSLAALVAGDVEPTGIAVRIGDDRRQVRRLPLVHRDLPLAPLGRFERLAGHANRH